MHSHLPILLSALVALTLIACASSSPLLISDDEAALLQSFSKRSRRDGHESEERGALFLIPTVRPHRLRRQSDGFGDIFSGLGGRLSSFRDTLRDTVRPIGEQLNPLPLVENMGKMLSEASTNTVTRGRSALQGVRDFGSRSVSRLRDGATDAWDNLRDNWEEFWDL